MKHRIGVYAGTFDPITFGHLSVISAASSLFDKLFVVVAVNPAKTPMFSTEERQTFIETVAPNGWMRESCELEVVAVTNRYIVDVALEVGAEHIVRGIRNASDYEVEYMMAHFNKDINDHHKKILQPAVTTIFLPADPRVGHVSSSAIKSLIGPAGWEEIVAEYVPIPVLNGIKAKYYGH